MKIELTQREIEKYIKEGVSKSFSLPQDYSIEFVVARKGDNKISAIVTTDKKEEAQSEPIKRSPEPEEPSSSIF